MPRKFCQKTDFFLTGNPELHGKITGMNHAMVKTGMPKASILYFNLEEFVAFCVLPSALLH
jgi:hypothetical protein